ncbi:MAG: hypothetical protein WBA51_14460 [Erythrobacter sp.]
MADGDGAFRKMSFAFALIFGAFLHQDAPKIVSQPKRGMTDSIAVVRYNCVLTDAEGQTTTLNLRKSGRQTYFGIYTDQDAADEFPLIEMPIYRVLEGSSSRLTTTLRYVPGGSSVSPSVGDTGDIVFLDDKGAPAALLRFPKHYAPSKGVSLSAFLPKATDPDSLETLAGVCLVKRLEDVLQ